MPYFQDHKSNVVGVCGRDLVEPLASNINQALTTLGRRLYFLNTKHWRRKNICIDVTRWGQADDKKSPNSESKEGLKSFEMSRKWMALHTLSKIQIKLCCCMLMPPVTPKDTSRPPRGEKKSLVLILKCESLTAHFSLPFVPEREPVWCTLWERTVPMCRIILRGNCQSSPDRYFWSEHGI